MDDLDFLIQEAEGHVMDLPSWVNPEVEPATTDQLELLEWLLIVSSSTPERMEEIERNFLNYTIQEAAEVITELFGNRLVDIRYNGTGKIKKGPASCRQNLINAVEDEKR